MNEQALTGLRLAFYGDDFTGSTDALEALTRAGVRTALFLDPPGAEALAGFGDLAAAGVAGVSRSLTPAQMDDELRPVFARLRDLGAPLVHYKVCSTFDSSPTVGSIGHAIEIGQEVFGSPWVPLLVGAPVLGRYCVFGNLFARSGPETEPFRLDRHPTMRRHPITPMDEADLRIHLARQTNRPIDLLDVRFLERPFAECAARLDDLRAGGGAEIVLFDILYDAHLAPLGRMIWDGTAETPAGGSLFCVGSSGVEYALAAHWRDAGLSPADPPDMAPAAPADRVVAVTGSCSPVTGRQIDWALANGFAEVAVRTADLAEGGAAAEAEQERVVRAGWDALAAGRSVLLHTSRGPGDARIGETREALRRGAAAGGSTGEILGLGLGRAVRALIGENGGVRRAAVCGGDTSGFVARELGITALTMAAPMAPGSPLCRVHAGGVVDGMEIVFKGGQVGTVDFFGRVRNGTVA